MIETLEWEKGYYIKVNSDKNGVLISANKAGLVSLSNHLLALAQDDVKDGSHIHFDEYNSLEDNSVELTVEKIDCAKIEEFFKR